MDSQVPQKKIRTPLGKRRIGDPPMLLVSSKKVRDKLGWIPKYDNLKQIITTAWSWHKKRFREIV